MQMQSSRQTQSPRAMRPAPTIPDRIPPQIQREPSRLEVQPVVATKDLSMPVRHSQSVPHTPTTLSKLREHSEYFNALLDPTKFTEGITMEAKLQELAKQYSSCLTIPASKLRVSCLCTWSGCATNTTSDRRNDGWECCGG